MKHISHRDSYYKYKKIFNYLIELTSDKNIIGQHVMLGRFERLAPINTWFCATMRRETSCLRMSAFVHGGPYF